MRNYIITLAALSLCACSAHTAQSLQTSQTPQTTDTTTVSVFRPAAETEQTITSPITVEASNNQKIQVMPCHDELDCMQKVTGICPNGYNGGQRLTAENNRKVGIAFKCITDEEKAQQIKAEAEEKAWRAAREQEMQKQVEEQAARDAAAKKKATAKKK